MSRGKEMKWKEDPVRERKVKEVGHNRIASSARIRRGCRVIRRSLEQFLLHESRFLRERKRNISERSFSQETF